MQVLILLMICFKIALCTRNQNGRDASWIEQSLNQLRSEQFWIDDAQKTLRMKLQTTQNKNIAKNVIFFLGDGMSISTITAARIYDGQLKGALGERNKLSFERFPYVGLSQTYCVDKQVPDSACTASAYLCGVKGNYETIGVTSNVTLNDCGAASDPQNHLHSIAEWAVNSGKAAGLVTNTRITHASPAGVYAHTSNRNFESDFDILKELEEDPQQCEDIAKQLIEHDTARQLKVILGGGAKKFLPNDTKDGNGNFGERLDGRNLLREWLEIRTRGKAKVVQNRTQLLNANIEDTDYLLGLFDPDHMAYHIDNDTNQPLLEEMVTVAIKLLQKDDNGYFLFVEGGRIDHAHHNTFAFKALDETVQFSKAIQKALDLTDAKETLIVVSADHGHTMTISGYPDIHNSITGLNTDKSEIDGLPYTTLSYANGPAFKNFYRSTKDGEVQRVDLRKLPGLGSADFRYPSAVPKKIETHDGTDVAIYANGPWSHLFSGVVEQNAIPFLMGFASCIGPGLHACSYNPSP